jgi:N-terminal domain on NACHT_NTPase and P-loop NTPases/NB-ARC domain
LHSLLTKCPLFRLLVCDVHVQEHVILLPLVSAQVSVDIADMAEAFAIVSLVSSIASLIDLSAKVVSRLREFTSKTSDVPKSFRSLSIQLPLLTATLQWIQTQIEASGLPNEVTNALTAVVDNTSEQVAAVQTYLSKVLPPDRASKLERAVKALKSLAMEDKVQQALERIRRNNDFLVLHQTTRHVDTGDIIVKELAKLSIRTPATTEAFGVCLIQAPQIEPDAFIGRIDELQQLQDWLLPANHPHRQCIVSIVGMGGMGKTQLSLAHVRDCADDYSSVFWMNANDEASLRQSMADISAVIFHNSTIALTQSADDEKLKIDQVQRWLSEPRNDQWLLIFDNYDDPNLPGLRSATGYDIRSFFPTRSQGNIIITSRSTRLSFSKQVRLQKLEDVNTSVTVLSQRSKRDLSQGNILSKSKTPQCLLMRIR